MMMSSSVTILKGNEIIVQSEFNMDGRGPLKDERIAADSYEKQAIYKLVEVRTPLHPLENNRV